MIVAPAVAPRGRLIEPKVLGDTRGFYFGRGVFTSAIRNISGREQDKNSIAKQVVLREAHGIWLPREQGNLVRIEQSEEFA